MPHFIALPLSKVGSFYLDICMNYIKSLHIEGFKKFSTIDVKFNEHMNILVGENEAGKSTILDAIKIVINQQYKNSDKSILRDLFNSAMVEEFKLNPCQETLPRILIELELELDPSMRNASYFYGEVCGNGEQEKFGIRFECRYDPELGAEIEHSILDGKIPYEYYVLTWTTFANRPYQMIKKPLNFLSINTGDQNQGTLFNYFNKTLFMSKYDEETRAKTKNDFRTKLEVLFEDIGLPPIASNRKFGIDNKKVILENIITVLEDSIPLENHGSGMESLIKTQIALDKSNGLNVILMEEPENHLSFSTLQKMLHEISNQQQSSQIIVATHSNMIASRLGLNNVLWITEGQVKSLMSVEQKTADFFVRADDNSFLQLLLAKKIFLVEGATEFLLLPKFYEQITGHSIEAEGISIISCNGISYKRYLDIANATNKKIAVITDNDNKSEKIEESKQFNNDKSHKNQRIFMGTTDEGWTWEDCVYKINKDELDSLIKVKTDKQYLFHGKCYGKVLGKMLNNKVETAYQMLMSGKNFNIPKYIQEAIQWLNE